MATATMRIDKLAINYAVPHLRERRADAPVHRDDGGMQRVQVWHDVSEVESGTLATSARYADFDDFWEPFTFAVGPAGSYLRQQDADRQQAIRDQCFALLGEPSGPFELEARAWYARGTRP